jgi:hypothetical protein
MYVHHIVNRYCSMPYYVLYITKPVYLSAVMHALVTYSVPHYTTSSNHMMYLHIHILSIQYVRVYSGIYIYYKAVYVYIYVGIYPFLYTSVFSAHPSNGDTLGLPCKCTTVGRGTSLQNLSTD